MVEFENPGPKLSRVELASFEEGIGYELPVEYRSFLLAVNGGRPVPDIVDVEGHPEFTTDVKALFGLRRVIESTCLDWWVKTLSERLEPGVLPIGSDSGGNVFCISLHPGDHGVVLYCDLQSVFADYGAVPDFYRVASTFGSFLCLLRPWE